MKARSWPLLLALALLPAACVSRPGGSYAPRAEHARDPRRADELNRNAADLMERDPAKAEGLLREALTCDLYHGPAHNNLGVIYLGQGKLYEAAGEFEWARKLMPGHPDPRINLALTLERAGKTDESIATYHTALEVYPGHIQAIKGLTRLEIRSGRTGPGTAGRLDEIALRGESEEWRGWAKLQAARFSGRSARDR